MSNEYMTINEVAELLRRRKMAIYRMISKGLLPAIKFGKKYLFDRAKINLMLNNLSV